MIGRFSDLDMMPGNTQQMHNHARDDDKLFAIAENEEEKEEEDDDLIISPTRPRARRIGSRGGSPYPKETKLSRQETPGNEEIKFSMTGGNPLR
jgi:hypothetical protein